MNIQLFLFILILILLSRLSFTFKDDGATLRDIVRMAWLPLAALFFIRFGTGWYLLLAWLLVSPALAWITESRSARQNIYRNRIRILILHIVVVGLICSPLLSLQPGRLPVWLMDVAGYLFPGVDIAEADLLKSQLVIFGLLFVLNEMNMVLRWLLQLLNLESLTYAMHMSGEEDNGGDRSINPEPAGYETRRAGSGDPAGSGGVGEPGDAAEPGDGSEAGGVTGGDMGGGPAGAKRNLDRGYVRDSRNHGINENEYNTGRVIGMLERIFVYIFVLLGQYGVIGFILAAKGVTRFRDLKTRTFAEYVLIGTLLSTLLAMAVGFIIMTALPGA